MGRLARFYTTSSTVLGPTDYTATASDSSVDVTVGDGIVRLPLAVDTPGQLIEIYNPSGGAISIRPQGSDTIRRDGASNPSGVSVAAGYTKLYLSDGTSTWHEF